MTRVFASYVTQAVRLPERLPGQVLGPLEQLKETYTMLEEAVQGWIEEGRVQGIEQGIEQGRTRERALLCRLAARKFGDDTSERLTAALAGVTDPDRLEQVGDWIIECATAAELLARVVDEGRPGDRS